MSAWNEGAIYTLALLAGTGGGWWSGSRLGLRMPSPWVTALLLLAGSLGGPLLTTRLLGPTLLSHALALLLAGLTVGWSFWPMGQKQGERKWL